MKTIHQKSALFSLLILMASGLFFLNLQSNTSKEGYRALLKAHPYSNPRRMMPKELGMMGKPAGLGARLFAHYGSDLGKTCTRKIASNYCYVKK